MHACDTELVGQTFSTPIASTTPTRLAQYDVLSVEIDQPVGSSLSPTTSMSRYACTEYGTSSHVYGEVTKPRVARFADDVHGQGSARCIAPVELREPHACRMIPAALEGLLRGTLHARMHTCRQRKASRVYIWICGSR